MLVDESIKNRILNIEWFSHCGTIDQTLKHFNICTTLRKAEKSCLSRKWENVSLEARGELSVFLCINHPKENNIWDNIVDEVHLFLSEKIEGKVRRRILELGLNEKIYDSVSWDLLNAIIEDFYSNLKPHGFFTDILGVYENGHLPCGWSGSWPEGKLSVY